ncbi:MAG: hypothetical protein WBE34_20615 [Candidatus Nitrosopolaris sp.]
MKGRSGHSTGSMIGVPTLGSVINEFYSTILKPPYQSGQENSRSSLKNVYSNLKEIDGFRIQNYLQNRFSLISLCKHIK